MIVLGVSHRTSPLAVREALAFPRDAMALALHRLCTEAGLVEAMILSTCNRVELYCRAENEAQATEAVERFLCAYHHRPPEDVLPFLYRFTGPEAVRHAFRVAA